MTPVLAAREVSKAYPGVLALDRVSFEVAQGEIVGLVGENGAGKTTLIKVLSGQTAPDGGQVLLDGEPLELASPNEALRHGIEVTPQEIQLVSDLSVAENIVLGTLPGKAGVVSWSGVKEAARGPAEAVRISSPITAEVGGLPIAEQRLVMIARALYRGGRVLMMDEPTVGLTREEIDRLFEVLDELRAEGRAIVYSSHNLDEMMRLTDRLVALRDGVRTGESDTAALSHDDIVHMIVGDALEGEKGVPRPSRREAGFGPPVLRVSKLSGSRFTAVDLEVRQGEIVGLAGLVGAGRTEIARTIAGIDRAKAGEMWLDGEPYAPRAPADALERGLAFVPEDRRAQGGVPGMSARENIGMARLPASSAGPLLRHRRERDAVRAGMKQLNVRPLDTEREFRFFSGGNQQKIILLRGLLTSPKLFILDEPTVGVDVGARAELYSLILGLAEGGAAVLLISSELEEIAHLADRAVVLRWGRVVTELEAPLDEATMLRHCYETTTNGSPK